MAVYFLVEDISLSTDFCYYEIVKNDLMLVDRKFEFVSSYFLRMNLGLPEGAGCYKKAVPCSDLLPIEPCFLGFRPVFVLFLLLGIC